MKTLKKIDIIIPAYKAQNTIDKNCSVYCNSKYIR